jgi:bifunctional non-homologous end joining protein LigD
MPIKETSAMASRQSLPGAIAAPLPEQVEPQLACAATAPPDGDDWLHEIKLDGYRILARVERGRVTLRTRRGNDWTDRLPELVTALAALPAEAAFLDGELVSVDARGASDFQRLQDALGRAPTARALCYYAFDLLYLDGVDLRGAGLAARKAVLSELLGHLPPALARTLRLSDHMIGQGPAVFAQAARMGLEGIVCKQRDAPYRSGRGRAWLKVKCSLRQELVVVGYSEPKGSRSHLGALLLATYAGDELVYRGRVGTGFSEARLRELHRKLVALGDRQPGLRHPPTGAEARDVRWVRPELVVEVAYAGLTQDGVLRHAKFLGLREDKPAAEVTLELGPTG